MSWLSERLNNKEKECLVLESLIVVVDEAKKKEKEIKMQWF